MKQTTHRGKQTHDRKTGAFLLAEAVEIANYYWQAKHIDNYFYKKWELAEERLDSLLTPPLRSANRHPFGEN